MHGRKRSIDLNTIAYDDRKMDIWMERIGKRIKKERIKKGLSLSKLAELANLSVSCISKAETKQCRISLKALAKIAAALDIPAGDLLEHGSCGSDPDERLQYRMDEQDTDLTESERFEDMTIETEEEIVDFILELTGELMEVLRKKQ